MKRRYTQDDLNQAFADGVAEGKRQVLETAEGRKLAPQMRETLTDEMAGELGIPREYVGRTAEVFRTLDGEIAGIVYDDDFDEPDSGPSRA